MSMSLVREDYLNPPRDAMDCQVTQPMDCHVTQPMDCHVTQPFVYDFYFSNYEEADWESVFRQIGIYSTVEGCMQKR